MVEPGMQPSLPPATTADPQPFANYKAAAAAAGIKVCENCGTTTTPLWRKDKQTGMMMCNVRRRSREGGQGVVPVWWVLRSFLCISP